MTSRSKSSPQVHQIKAIFEGYRHALTRPSDQNKRGSSYRSKSSTDISDQNDEQPDQALIAREQTNDLADSIESIIDTNLPVPSTTRPALSQKPSWVGPPQANRRLYDPNMTRKVPIEYAAANLRPPVYITTSLSNPPWEIIEMEAINHNEGQYLFKAEFDAMEGEYQYKFRLGPGDWWVCDESKPTIDDGIGNRNNILFVPGVDSLAKGQVIGHAQPSGDASGSSNERDIPSKPVNESVSLIDLDAVHNSTNTTVSTTDSSVRSTDVEASQEDEDGYHDDQIMDQDEDAAPLMRHETISPSLADSPVAISSRSPASDRSTSGPPISPEGDPNDPSLHHFPTHHAGIMHELSRTRRYLPEDQTDDIVIITPTRVSSNVFASDSKLGTVREDQDSEDMLLIVGEREETLITPAPTPKDESRPEESSGEGTKCVEDASSTHERSHHHKHKHHHPPPAVEDMLEERPLNQQVMARPARCLLINALEAYIGPVMAVAVVVVAVLIYSAGVFSTHDVVKDGGAVLNG